MNAPLRRDLGIVTLAAISFFVLAPAWAGVLSHFSTPDLWFGSDLSMLYWIRWGARLAGRWPFDLLAGIVLGAWLRRINPWHVWLACVVIVLTVIVVNRAFLGTDGGRWVTQIGLGWAMFQLTVQVAEILAITSQGILIGRRIHSSRPEPVK